MTKLYDRLWQQLTEQYHNNTLAHGLLAGGMSGLGKREFVWQFIAWALCPYRNQMTACQACADCRLLPNHPNIQSLPKDDKAVSVDEVRALQPFVYQAGKTRFVVIDQADTLKGASANALLKMLEEPSDGAFFILISDHPARLLPTIKSRVQRLRFLANGDDGRPTDGDMLLAIADFAPKRAIGLPKEAWFARRDDWLKSFWLLQTGKRAPTQALSFWQKALAFDDFLTLCHYMLLEVWRFGLGMPVLHTDLDIHLLDELTFSQRQLTAMMGVFFEVDKARKQNVQELLCYERLLVALTLSAFD